jgi:hypothetical protein
MTKASRYTYSQIYLKNDLCHPPQTTTAIGRVGNRIPDVNRANQRTISRGLISTSNEERHEERKQCSQPLMTCVPGTRLKVARVVPRIIFFLCFCVFVCGRGLESVDSWCRWLGRWLRCGAVRCGAVGAFGAVDAIEGGLIRLDCPSLRHDQFMIFPDIRFNKFKIYLGSQKLASL